MSDTIWAILIGAVMLAILVMLVRPNSPAVTAITTVSDALAALISVSVSNYNGGKTNG